MAPNFQTLLKRKGDGPKGPNDATPKPGFWKRLNWKLLVSLALPVMLETLDYTVVASAQPHIVSVFNAVNLQSYIGTLYILSTAAFLPLFASAADVYGRHLTLQVSLLFFLIGSAISTGGINMPMVLAGRGIAGIGAAGLLTIVRTIISDSASPDGSNPQEAVLYILYGLSFAMGAVIGGFMVTVNFRWVFIINLPTSALAMVLCYFFLRSQVKDRKPDEGIPTLAGNKETWISKLSLLDWTGTALFLVGGIFILLALNWGPNDHWKTPRVIASLIISIVFFLACLSWEYLLEKRQTNTFSSSRPIFRASPMLPLKFFASYDFCVVQYSSFVSGIVMFAIFYFLGIFMIIVFALQPTNATMQLLFYAPGMAVGMFSAGRMLKYLRQPKYPLVLGFIFITVGLGLVVMGMQGLNDVLIDVSMVITGLGTGLTASPLIVQGKYSTPGQIALLTSPTMLFFRSLGGMLGLAQCFTIMNAKVNAYVAAQISAGALSSSDLATLSQLFESGGLTSLKILGKLPAAVQEVIRGAYDYAIRWSFISLVPWTGVAVLLTLFLSRIPAPAPVEQQDLEFNRRGSEERERTEPLSSNASSQKLLVQESVLSLGGSDK
ncbi:MFS general substrate transporter [Leucogyrophana mollusca]|uniref:MFS general substrate transporter n=1 Tax=Leucogyrophana mollusca TaxID=85980 RepID=A0ACB8BU80_9AGAM|nr:MFS general substrate transporter [Leucogyrophana mollusca]